MKKLLLVGLLAVSLGAFAEDIRRDSFDQISEGLEINQPGFKEKQEQYSKEQDAYVNRVLEERAALAKKPSARIGMTAKQVRNNTNWGKPDKVNETLDSRGSFQQWVYGDEYLYFKNGKLVSIQTSR